MLKSNYMKWSKKMVIVDMLGVMTWMSLTTFMLMAKTAMGTTVIPVFELIIFIMGMIGVSLAHNKFMTVKGSTLVRIIQETVFLIALFYVLLTTDNVMLAGYVVYSVIITSAIINKITGETTRSYEDNKFRGYTSTKFLKLLRKKNQYLELVAGAIGTSIAVLFLTVGEVDIITFTLFMLVANVIQNVYEFYIWKKYL